mmetsp:Transcript_20946/g.34237  ORF Transcript_20946/g.34237 Transcript_20946/m.34237 type:complete len:212 (-) Transcript_20946:8-643(-)
MHRKEIISVHTNTSHSISRSTRNDTITSILIFYRSRNCVAIIPTEEYHRRLKRSGKVTRRVKVGGRRSSITKVDNRNSRFLLRIGNGIQLELVSRSHRLSNLRAQWTTNRLVVQRTTAVMDGHLPSLAQIQIIGEALVAKLLQCEATPHEHARLAVLRKDMVLWLQCRSRSHVNCLFAMVGHVKRNAALTLGVMQDGIHLSQSDHLSMSAK